MTTVLAQYDVLHRALASRRRRPEEVKGLDGLNAWAQLKIRESRITRGWLRREAERIDTDRTSLRNTSDAALNQHVHEIREVFVRGRQDHAAVRRGFSLVREVARRETDEEAFVVQLMGAMALYHGRIIEMLTGEGKTLTGSLAAPLIAWRRRHLHVLTVNDYLATRDAQSRESIYHRCGLSVGAITQDLPHGDRGPIYRRSIVYGTPKQITADWLRDQIRLGRLDSAWSARQTASQLPGGGGLTPIVPGLSAALVDEADAVLIDEGVVPLIIARARREDDMAEVYREAARVARKLDEGPDYTIDHLRRKADLRSRGRHRIAQLTESFSDPLWKANRRAEELVRQAIVARHCYLAGRQYQIVDGRVIIVDEYTGRFLPDRSWEHGLHQAVEAKEGVEVTADRETLARVSFQRFFRSYPFLCGMTGTAADGIREMERVYSRPVTVIPTNRPMIRERWRARVFRTAEAKWSAVVDSIEQVHSQQRPILVGTRSIEASELLSERLDARGLRHRVLNANFDEDEAVLISEAGLHGRITVATNMAGRGTDIKLDEKSKQAGGLHVILTEMHGSQRIDRQFFGRAGRQGDPGSAQMFVSLEDELVRLHASGFASYLRESVSSEELREPRLRLARRAFRMAQRRSEARDRRSRAAVLRQDDWIDKHLPGR